MLLMKYLLESEYIYIFSQVLQIINDDRVHLLLFSKSSVTPYIKSNIFKSTLPLHYIYIIYIYMWHNAYWSQFSETYYHQDGARNHTQIVNVDSMSLPNETPLPAMVDLRFWYLIGGVRSVWSEIFFCLLIPHQSHREVHMLIMLSHFLYSDSKANSTCHKYIYSYVYNYRPIGGQHNFSAFTE